MELVQGSLITEKDCAYAGTVGILAHQKGPAEASFSSGTVCAAVPCSTPFVSKTGSCTDFHSMKTAPSVLRQATISATWNVSCSAWLYAVTV